MSLSFVIVLGVIQFFYFIGVMFTNNFAAYFECGCQFSTCRVERPAQQYELLDLFVIGKLLLEHFYAFGHHFAYLHVAA